MHTSDSTHKDLMLGLSRRRGREPTEWTDGIRESSKVSWWDILRALQDRTDSQGRGEKENAKWTRDSKIQELFVKEII